MVDYINQQVEFVDPIEPKRPGARRVQIPPEIGDWMERTYATGTAAQIDIPGGNLDDPDLNEFIRMINLYAKRKGKKAQSWITPAQKHQQHPKLAFLMLDKKKYNRVKPLQSR